KRSRRAVAYWCCACAAFAVCLLVLGFGLRAGAGSALAAPQSKAGPLATPTPTPTCGAAWSIVPSPSVGALDNFLFGVAVISADAIWAVGSYYDDNFLSHT